MEYYNKHYIRLDENNNIIYGFSDAFEQPQDDDICVKEQGGRHFEIEGKFNPLLLNTQGVYLYRYVDGEVVEKTPEEMQSGVTEPMTTLPSDIELLTIELTTAMAQMQVDNAMAIAELSMAIATMGGVNNV